MLIDPSSSLCGSPYVVVFIVTVDIHGCFSFVPNLKSLMFLEPFTNNQAF